MRASSLYYSKCECDKEGSGEEFYGKEGGGVAREIIAHAQNDPHVSPFMVQLFSFPPLLNRSLDSTISSVGFGLSIVCAILACRT